MNRIDTCFQNPKQERLNVYFTAGYPTPGAILEIMQALQAGGADVIELGMPFSDPLADGPTIQESSAIALTQGMSIPTLFEELEGFREHIHIPVVLMGYLNPILQFGTDAFKRKAKEVGIDGFIIPDLTPDEYTSEWKSKLELHDLSFSFLITPQTSSERIQYLDSLTRGFMYAVASASTTGGADFNQEDLKNYLTRIQSLKLKNPHMVGFGISNAEQFQLVNRYSDGAIVGSAFIKHLKKHGVDQEAIVAWVESLKKGS